MEINKKITIRGGRLNLSECKVIPKRIEKFEMRLFEEEIDIAQFLCFFHNLSYEQLFVKLIKEHAEHNLANNKNYKFDIWEEE